MKRIKHNNLLPWFTQDHGTLPTSYLASCEKFFKELSAKQQATSLTIVRNGIIKDVERRKYANNKK